MTLRCTAHLLIVVMLAASGRLLACGLECLNERPASSEASCHQDSAPAAALTGDGMHACLPEVTEPRVTAAKPATAQLLIAAPLVTVFVIDRLLPASLLPDQSFRNRRSPPPAPAFSVLRI